MGWWDRNRSKDGDQGRARIRRKHRTTSHEPPQSNGQSEDSEQFSQKGHVTSSPALSNAECVLSKQEENPESSMTQEDQPIIDDRIEGKHPNTNCHMPQQAEPAEAYQGPQLSPQKEVDALNDSSQRQEAVVLVDQGDQFSPQDKVILLDNTQSQLHDTGSIEVRRQRRSHSQSRGDALDGVQEPSPKKNGARQIIHRTFREENYAPSHKDKATSDRKRQGKESHEQKQRESSTYGQKRLPLEPPSSYPAHSRPETSQAQPELPLARRDSFKSTSGIPQQKFDSSRPGGGRDPDLTRAQVPPQAIETVDTHAWERHLPQSADDATIQLKVLTLFEFIEHHVDGYYRDTRTKISQLPVQLAKLQSCYLPSGIPLEDLLLQARYQGPVIKHCLINLVVSGMVADESPLFSLLPEEFTTIPRAVRRNRGEIKKRPYQDQALSNLRSLCIHLLPNVQKDPDYTRKLDESIAQAVTLCLAAFSPWARDQDPENRHQNLIALFHMAADVGLLLFSQPSCLIFDWKSSERGGSASDILVWPRLLRTTNPNAEPLTRPQIIVESSSQSIGYEVASLRPIPKKSEGSPERRIQAITKVYELSDTNAQETTFERPAHSNPYSVPIELAAPEGYVSATVHGPQNTPYAFPAPKTIDQRTQDRDYDLVHSLTTPSQHKALDQDAGNLDMQGKSNVEMQNRSNAIARRPVASASTRIQ